MNNMPEEKAKEGIKAPPRTILGILGAVGPGIVVIGSVMGSGELINTPKQASLFGFVLLWAVIVSCVIKYFLQIEIGRHTLAHNRTPLESLNSLPFPKFRGTSWIGLVFVFSTIPTSLVFAGMLGATSGLTHSIIPLSNSPEFSAQIWMAILAVIIFGILWRNVYLEMEKLITFLVLGFSISVVLGVLLIQGTEFRFTIDDIISGMTFSLGDNHSAAAIAVISLMGSLGATANELFMYPYWILEKGYTRFVGSPKSDGWVERTHGWIRILQIDIGITTLLATVITAAYFLIGASVLHRQGIDPKGLDVVNELSRMFTDTYGDWSRLVFLAGAFCTLFSTIIVGIAAFGRMWGDMLISLKLIPAQDPAALKRTHRIIELSYMVVLFLISISSFDPVANIIFGQFFAGLVGMPLLMFAICWLAFRTDRRVRMGRLSAIFLVISVIAIIACLIISTIILINKWMVA